MKRTVLVFLATVLLLTVVPLTSCSIRLNKSNLTDVLDTDASYQGKHNAFTRIEAIPDVQGMTLNTSVGKLYHFRSDASPFKTVIYNAETGKTLLTLEEGENGDTTHFINLLSAGELSCFAVQTRVGSVFVSTELYSENGTRLATADGAATLYNIADIAVFDGKCYRTDVDGVLNYAFDLPASWDTVAVEKTVNHYQPLTVVRPSPDTYDAKYVKKLGDYYYNAGVKGVVTVFDGTLNFLYKYTYSQYSKRPVEALKPYYPKDQSKPIGVLPLSDGRLFIQYAYKPELGSTDDVTFFRVKNGVSEGYKCVTVILSPEKKEAKEIACEYVLLEPLYTSENNANGILPDKLPLATFASLSDKKPDKEFLATVDGQGTVEGLTLDNGKDIQSLKMVADDRWAVTSDVAEYLINGKARTVGKLPESASHSDGRYLYEVNNEGKPDGKIYDYSLKPLIDTKANGLTPVATVGASAVFIDKDGSYVLYKGGKETTVIASKNFAKSFVGTVGDCFVLKNSENKSEPTAELYNSDGVLLISVKTDGLTQTVPFTLEGEGDGFAVFSAADAMGNRIFYRIGT